MSYKPLISIIVPVYNVKQYLDECVQSIINQTYKNLEIILVDDGSTDGCSKLCDDWVAKDSRIRVIHKQNGGLSDARNAGMQIASGELIGFVDSDDYISNDMYELLYANMCQNNSDISACGVEMFYEDGSPSKSLTPKGETVLDTVEAVRKLINESVIKQPVWYKLYKRKLIEDILFPVGKCHEDVFWSYKAIGNAKIISIFDKPCYFYRQRSGSIMGTQYSLKRLDALEAKSERSTYMQKHFPELALVANVDFWFACIYSMQMSMTHLNSTDYKIAKDLILAHKKSINTKGIFESLRSKHKIWFCMSKVSLLLTCRLRNFLKIGF